MAIQPQPFLRKKKILVLVSRGGGGHKTAGDSLKQILGDSYDIETNYIFGDILGNIDILNRVTRGKFTGEDLYNFFLRNHQKTLLKMMIKEGCRHMQPD